MPIEWRKEWTAPSVAGVVCFGLGVTVGYIVCSRRKESIIHYVTVNEPEPVQGEITEQESGDSITHLIVDEEVITTIITRADDMAEIDMAPKLESRTVFPETEDDWDYEEEAKTRGSEKPYVIHRDEYYQNEKDYGQTTLTYYAGDDVLVDENDVPLYNQEKITGPLPFGKGSGDPSIVHIRNDHLEAEYEVILDAGHYAVEVLGVNMEHELSEEKPIIHKFRQD